MVLFHAKGPSKGKLDKCGLLKEGLCEIAVSGIPEEPFDQRGGVGPGDGSEWGEEID